MRPMYVAVPSGMLMERLGNDWTRFCSVISDADVLPTSEYISYYSNYSQRLDLKRKKLKPAFALKILHVTEGEKENQRI